MGMANLPQNKTAIRQAQFVERAANELNLDPAVVKDLLRVRFSSYSPIKEGEYMVYLRNENAKMVEQEEWEEKQRKAMEEQLAGIHFPEMCPTHNVKISGDLRWGKYGFRCPKGGSRCYHRWRVSEIARKRGVEVSFEALDKVLEQNPGWTPDGGYHERSKDQVAA